MSDQTADTQDTATDDPEQAAADAQADASQTSGSSRAKGADTAIIGQILNQGSLNDPNERSLIAQYGVNAQQARDILQKARDTLVQQTPQLQNAAMWAGMKGFGGGDIASNMTGAALGEQQSIQKQLMDYDLMGNQANKGSLDAQLKLLTDRYGAIGKLGPAAVRGLNLPDQANKLSGSAQQADQFATELGIEKGTPDYKAFVEKFAENAEQGKLYPTASGFLPASQARGKQPFNQQVAAAGAIPEDAKEAFYQYVAANGKPPPGFTRSGPIAMAMWANAKKRGDEDGNSIASMVAAGNIRTANTTALTQGTKMESAISSYYDTMDKNLGNLLDLSGKIDSSGSPLINKVFRAYQQGVTGDPDVAKYVTYLNAVESEFAKIQSGALGNQATTDAQRKDAKDTINKFMGQGTIEAVAEGMRGEGMNRLSSMRDQNTYLRTQLGVKNPQAPVTPGETPKGPAAATAAKAMPSGPKLNAYAAAHFGGDSGKATAFLQSQGYK
jgi:hypothetical protein